MPLSMADVQLDETSCGPQCQHPQCWASNRRVARGLPRLDAITADRVVESSEEYGGLPTLKVHNILDDYGFSSADLHPSPYQQTVSPVAREASGVHSRQRSASAPSINAGKSYKRGPSRSGQSRRERHPSSRPPHLEPIQQSYPPRLAKVHLDQICGPMAPSNENRTGQMVYIWQPSEKSLQSAEPPPVRGTESKPIVVSPRDITEALIPASIADQIHSQKRMRSMPSKQTPTGGRPYTHPTKTPPQIVRRTMPADVDDGIAQLLSLPRDIILEILEHTKESDLFDKDKVQVLLEKVMPQVRFNEDKRVTPDLHSRSPPLHAMGLLRNKKMPILEGRKKFEKAEVPLQSLPKLPVVLDVSEAGRSSVVLDVSEAGRLYTGGGDKRLYQNKPLRITDTMPNVDHLLKNKITSVSAKSLPPLLPGSKVTKPFHYSIQSLDLALTPLRTPENPPSSPRSENASTLYVTVPSEPSEHTLQSTAKHPHLAVIRQESPASSHHSYGMVNHRPSYSPYKGPYNLSPLPYGSPGGFNTPHGTPLPYGSPGLSPAGPESQEKGPVAGLGSGSTSHGTLQTIHEYPAATPDTTEAAPSPTSKQLRSVSPWENPGRHQSRTLSTPTNPSPEVWPVVDEESYLHSPENASEPLDDRPETVAPPPSPAPSVRSGMLEEDAASTDGAAIQTVVECNQGMGPDSSMEEQTTGDRPVEEGEKRVLSAIREDETGQESERIGDDDSPCGSPLAEEKDGLGNTSDGDGLENTSGGGLGGPGNKAGVHEGEQEDDQLAKDRLVIDDGGGGNQLSSNDSEDTSSAEYMRSRVMKDVKGTGTRSKIEDGEMMNSLGGIKFDHDSSCNDGERVGSDVKNKEERDSSGLTVNRGNKSDETYHQTTLVEADVAAPTIMSGTASSNPECEEGDNTFQ